MLRPEDNVLCFIPVTPSIASDHFSVVCELRVAVPSDPAVYKESRNIREIDRAAFRAVEFCACLFPLSYVPRLTISIVRFSLCKKTNKKNMNLCVVDECVLIGLSLCTEMSKMN